MSMYEKLSERLMAALHLAVPPVAVSFPKPSTVGDGQAGNPGSGWLCILGARCKSSGNYYRE